ncbi:hypothetical protein KL937_001968, partial [Ogataea polymorpha]
TAINRSQYMNRNICMSGNKFWDRCNSSGFCHSGHGYVSFPSLRMSFNDGREKNISKEAKIVGHGVDLYNATSAEKARKIPPLMDPFPALKQLP